MFYRLNTGSGPLSAVEEIDGPPAGDFVRLVAYFRSGTFADTEAMTQSVDKLNQLWSERGNRGYFVEGRFDQGNDKLSTLFLVADDYPINYQDVSLAFHKMGFMEEPGKWRELMSESRTGHSR